MKQRFDLVCLSATVLVMFAGPAAKADSIRVVRTPAGFQSNDAVNWEALGIGVKVPEGTTLPSDTGFTTTTIAFSKPGAGRSGSTFCEIPGAACTWNGNFAPSASLLTPINEQTGLSEGGFDLTLSRGIASVGFQIQSDSFGGFNYVVQALDENAVLGTFYGVGLSNGQNNDSAVFFGLEDLTAPDITSIRINAYHCVYGTNPSCTFGFAVSNLLVQDTNLSALLAQDTHLSATPELPNLILLGSGLGVLALVRGALHKFSKES